MRAANSSSPSVKDTSPDHPVTIHSIRPHAQVAAGVSVFVWLDPLRGTDRSRSNLDRPRNAERPRMERVRAVRFDIAQTVMMHDAGELAPDDVTTFGFLQQLVHASETLFVIPAVVELLARRDHSRAELERKLRRKGFSPTACEDAVQYARERGYQSDRRFAESWIRGMMRGSGRSRTYLYTGLTTRGVMGDVATEALDEYEQDNPGCFGAALQEQAERVVRRIASTAEPPDYHGLTPRQQRTVISRLMSRGFSMKEIREHFA